MEITALCLAVGSIWEYVTPVMKPSSISDPIDIVCYVCGGIIYWLILRISKWLFTQNQQ